MTAPTCFDPGLFDHPPHPSPPPDPGEPPRNDAAATAIAAGVQGSENTHDGTLLQLPLRPPARKNAPKGTSRVAADRIAGHARQQRADVFAAIVRAGAIGATDAEIEVATGLRAQSVSPRRGELVKLGMIADSGQRRLTPRGRPAAVWCVARATTPVDAPRGSGEPSAGVAR